YDFRPDIRIAPVELCLPNQCSDRRLYSLSDEFFHIKTRLTYTGGLLFRQLVPLFLLFPLFPLLVDFNILQAQECRPCNRCRCWSSPPSCGPSRNKCVCLARRITPSPPTHHARSLALSIRISGVISSSLIRTSTPRLHHRYTSRAYYSFPYRQAARSRPLRICCSRKVRFFRT